MLVEPAEPMTAAPTGCDIHVQSGNGKPARPPSLCSVKMPHAPDLDDQLRSLLLRSLLSEREDQEYQREVLSTAAGRESARLRHRAVVLAASDRQEEAHALLLEAVQLHPEADVGAAAGSARYDLGHSFLSRRLGVRIENLLAAERLFRAALVLGRSRLRTALIAHGLVPVTEGGVCVLVGLGGCLSATP